MSPGGRGRLVEVQCVLMRGVTRRRGTVREWAWSLHPGAACRFPLWGTAARLSHLLAALKKGPPSCCQRGKRRMLAPSILHHAWRAPPSGGERGGTTIPSLPYNINCHAESPASHGSTGPLASPTPHCSKKNAARKRTSVARGSSSTTKIQVSTAAHKSLCPRRTAALQWRSLAQNDCSHARSSKPPARIAREGCAGGGKRVLARP